MSSLTWSRPPRSVRDTPRAAARRSHTLSTPRSAGSGSRCGPFGVIVASRPLPGDRPPKPRSRQPHNHFHRVSRAGLVCASPTRGRTHRAPGALVPARGPRGGGRPAGEGPPRADEGVAGGGGGHGRAGGSRRGGGHGGAGGPARTPLAGLPGQRGGAHASGAGGSLKRGLRLRPRAPQGRLGRTAGLGAPTAAP